MSRIRARWRPALVPASLCALLIALSGPADADAHGLAGSPTPGVPNWLFAWGAAVVLLASFLALAALWQQPRLQAVRERELIRLPRWLDAACGALGVAAFVLVVGAGLVGAQDTLDNILPTVLFVYVWVVIPLLSGLLGDVFAAFNPWRAVGRAASWAAGRLAGPDAVAPPVAYPRWLGRWPAVVGIVAFGWVELVSTSRDDPSALAIMAIAYAATQLVAMSVFGQREWERNGDPLAVLFGLFARLSPLRWSAGRLFVRRPLAGVTALDVNAGTMALVLAAIGVTTFDGLSAGPLWTDVAPTLQRWFQDIGLGAGRAIEAAGTAGLLACIVVVAAFYALGIRGVRSIDPARSSDELARAFIHTLVPIALAYVAAHYVSLVVFQGQGLIYLASDPLGHGWDLLGTSGFAIDYRLVPATAIWYVQVAALLAGHVSALALAHDRALALFPDSRTAVRSQYWMLAVMVGFTNLGMWLISAANQ
jgi:hypothetical protein